MLNGLPCSKNVVKRRAVALVYDQLRWNSPAEDTLCDQQPAQGKHEPEGAAEAHIAKLFQHRSATELQPKPHLNMSL